MKLLVCGTPGTGKTSLALSLSYYSFHFFNLNTFAYYTNSFLGYDKTREAYIIDSEKIKRKINKLFLIVNKFIIDSHIIDCFSDKFDKIIILRCDPLQLYKRLKRKYDKKKILENIEAEFLNVISIECNKIFKKSQKIEINNTNFKDTKKNIIKLLKDPFLANKYQKSIDWLNIYEKKNKLEEYFRLISRLKEKSIQK